MILKLSDEARSLKDLLTRAAAEASRRGDQRIGTDHLLLAVLADPSSDAAQIIDVDLATARGCAAELDRVALASIGIRLGQIPELRAASAPRRMAPLTSEARAVLARAHRNARPAGRRLAPRDLLLALFERARPDPAAELLAALQIDTAAVRARLAIARPEAR